LIIPNEIKLKLRRMKEMSMIYSLKSPSGIEKHWGKSPECFWGESTLSEAISSF